MNLRNRLLVLVLLCSLSGLNLFAQSKYYIDIWGVGGYSMLNHGIEGTKVPGGAGGALGFGYEYNYNNFIILAGVEFMHLSSSTRLESYAGVYHDYLYPEIENYLIPFHYTFDSYQEKHKLSYLNVPLLFGLKFSNYYAMLGGRFGLNLQTNYSIDAVLRTSAHDPVLIKPIEELRKYGIGAKEMNQKGSLDFGINTSLTLEFGTHLDQWLPRNMTQMNNRRRTNLSYRAGVFVDYGVMNLKKSITTEPIVGTPVDNDDMLKVPINSLSSSNLSRDSRFGSLFAGVKLTVLFDMTRQKSKPKARPSQQTVFPFFAQVVDSETNQGLDAEVSVRFTSGNREVFTQQTDVDGMVSHDALRKGRYTVLTSSKGYINYRKVVSHLKEDTLTIALQRVPIFNIHVTDSETKQNLLAEVVLNNVGDQQEVVLRQSTDSETGVLASQLESDRYQLNVTSEGYLYHQEVINHSSGNMIEVALQPIKKDVKVVLHNIFFELNSAELTPESAPALEDLYQFLGKNPNVKIHIVGHTDNTGNASYNKILSENRAKSIYDVIVAKGIDGSRLTYEGRGSSEPVSTNDTEGGRSTNRRVEFVIQ